MHRTTKATAISKTVKEAVSLRDKGRCIFCGRPGKPVAHVVRRSQLGMGIEQNIITVCDICHRKMDEGRTREAMYARAVAYLKGFYPEWTRDDMIYKKWR